VIGKIVLTMLVAAAKINQSSIVPAFDQTRVPRIIQVPSGAAISTYGQLNLVESSYGAEAPRGYKCVILGRIPSKCMASAVYERISHGVFKMTSAKKRTYSSEFSLYFGGNISVLSSWDLAHVVVGERNCT